MEFSKSQAIKFSGLEDFHSQAVYSSEIDVAVSSSVHTTGNSKIKLKNLVDYHWEHKYYLGKLVAVHLSGIYVAYVIKGPNNVGIISVINLKTQERIRLKGREGMIKDISFAHLQDEIILASVNEYGHLLVFQVNEAEYELKYTLLVNIERQLDTASSEFHRVTWCPYIPDDEADNEDVSKLLVLTHGCMAEMWNIEIVKNKYGSDALKPDDIAEGCIQIDNHDFPIIDVAFSPDGSALAIAYENGIVKFFQVYIYNSDGPRCLHVWDPHMGKPLSSLFFLDNLKCPNPEIQYWKFAVTGANNNREIKIWSCATWTTLQTIHIHTPEDENCILKAETDLGSQFLFLSDIYRNVLYVLHIEDKLDGVAVTSITQFLLPCAVLSFSIVDAGVRKCKNNKNNGVENNLIDDQEEQSTNNVSIKLYLVQPKSLQEARITFKPASSNKTLPSSVASLSQESLTFRDTLSDLNITSDVDSSQLEDTLIYPGLKSRSSLNNVSNPSILMTPDAFSSARNGKASDVSPAMVSLPTPGSDSVTDDTEKNSPTDKIPNGCTRTRSGGSSPSREVREILGENYSEEKKTPENEYSEQKYEALESSATKFPTPPIPSETAYHDSDLNNVASATSSQGEEPVWSKDFEAESDMLLTRTLPEMEEQNMQLDDKESNSDLHGSSLVKNNDLGLLIHNTSSILKIVHQQQAEILELKRKMNQMQLCMISPESNNCKSVEELVKTVNSKVEDTLHNLSIREKEKWQSLSGALAEELAKVVITNLRILIRTEMRSPVVSVLLEQFEQVQENILREIAQRLNATDHLIKDRIQVIMKSEEFQDLLARSTARKLQPAIISSYKDSFANVIVPNFEKCSENMIKQINDHFSRGTKEYTEQLESYLDRHRKTLEKTKDSSSISTTVQLQNVIDNVTQSNRALGSNITSEVVTKLQSLCSNVQDNLSKKIRDIVKSEVHKCFAEQKMMIEGSVLNAVRSRSVTPAPNLIDSQAQTNHILNLLSTKQYNSAFQAALSASDLNFVVFTCEKLSPNELFSITPCPLQQPILLSLIQQLSADLSSHTRLKHTYLSEAVMALDGNDPVVIEHMPTVLNGLMIKLKDFLDRHSSHQLYKDMKILLLIVRSLISGSMP